MVALALLSSASPAISQTTTQFQEFFPAWNKWLLDIIDKHCADEREKYEIPSGGHNRAFNFANCILDNMLESSKVEMGVASLLLGLLPTILQSIGPSVDEVSILATRRPLLAFMLSFGMPFVRLNRSPAEHLKTLQTPLELDFISDKVDKWPWLWIFISAGEYLFAAAAAANIFYLVYQLAFLSVSISAISIESNALPQTYPPFLWILLLIPVYLLSCLSLRLGYKIQYAPIKKQAFARRTWLQVIGDEFMPCAKTDGLHVEKRKQPRYMLLSAVSSWLTNMAMLILFVFGTVFLSSQMFIGLGDMIPVIARVIGSCLVSRGVMLLELYGLRRATAGTCQQWGNVDVPVTQSTYAPVTKLAQDEHTSWQ
jgi:hypothetical protein